jgi:hypothetical protein
MAETQRHSAFTAKIYAKRDQQRKAAKGGAGKKEL